MSHTLSHPSLLQFHAEAPEKGRAEVQQAPPLEFSPWADSLASPASSRDFGSPLIAELDFNTNGNEPALFPSATQQEASQNWLADVDLFADDYSTVVNNALSASQQSQSQSQHNVQRLSQVQQLLDQYSREYAPSQVPSPPAAAATTNMGAVNSSTIGDFSFDGTLATMGLATSKQQQQQSSDTAMLGVPIDSRSVSRSNSAASLLSASASQGSASSFASSQDTSINQLAAVFVREYARTHEVRDINVLVRALQVSGIEVSDDVVQELLLRKSSSPSPQPCTSSQASQTSDEASSQTSEASSIHRHRYDLYRKANSNYWTTEQIQAQYGGVISSSQSDDAMVEDAPAVIDAASSPVAKKVAAPKARSSSHTTAKASLTGPSSEPLTIGTGANKRFVCPTCSKTFDRAFNLRTHATTHIDPEERERPFTCPWGPCDKDFARKHDALRHYKSVHVRRGEIATDEEIHDATAGASTVVAT